MKGLRRQISLPKFYRDKTDFARTRFHESSCLQGIIHKRSKQQCPKIANLRAFRLETDTLVPKPRTKQQRERPLCAIEEIVTAIISDLDR